MFLLLFLFPSGTSAGVQAQAPPPEPGFILSPVTAEGVVLSDLTPRDLEVRVGSGRVPVRALTPFHDAPIRIVIVLDESSSMGARWHVALAIVLDLLQTLPPNSSVGLVGVNNESPELIRGPGAITRYLYNRRKRGPGGWTRLWDDMDIALRALPQPQPSDLIFVVSDGVDTASKLTFRGLQEEVRAARVRVSGALLTDEFAPDPVARSSTGNLAELIDETGGWNLTSMPFLQPHRAAGGRIEEPRSAFPNLNGFFRTLYDFYLVDLGGAATPAAPTGLSVRLAAGRQDRERIYLSAPNRLLPGSP